MSGSATRWQLSLWGLQPVKSVRLTLAVICADRKIHCFPWLPRAQVYCRSSPIRVFLEPAFLYVPFPAVPSQTQGCWGGESEGRQGKQRFLWVCFLARIGGGGVCHRVRVYQWPEDSVRPLMIRGLMDGKGVSQERHCQGDQRVRAATPAPPPLIPICSH